MDKLLKIINQIMLKKEGRTELKNLNKDLSLTEDLGLDSLDLAELTVRIEDEYGVDIFENGIINKVHEIIEQLPKGQ